MRIPATALALLALSAPFTKPQAPAEITRLDGTKISLADADAFARKAFADAHVTGAQITVLNRGEIVWSAAYGLRRKDPPLPMDQETTNWAASVRNARHAFNPSEVLRLNVIQA